MGLETALLRNHERLGKIALTGGFAFGFAYTTKTGTSPLAGWGWTPRTREASARARRRRTIDDCCCCKKNGFVRTTMARGDRRARFD